jgi:hypothetical protein
MTAMHYRYVCLLILLLAVTSCAVEVGEPPAQDYDALVAEAKASLAAGDSKTAHGLLQEALGVRPNDPDASLGLVLANVQGLCVLLDEILSFVTDLAGAQVMALENPGGLSPGSTLDDTIHHFLKHIGETILDETNLALDDALAAADVEFAVDHLPLALQGELLADWGGEWDATDAVWLSAVVRAANGVVDMIQGLNLDLDIGPLLASELLASLATGAPLDYATAIPELFEILLGILEDPDFPDFLLANDETDRRFARAQFHFALAAIRGIDAWPLAAAETDAQDDDLLAYVAPQQSYAFAGEPLPEWLNDALPALRAIGFGLYVALAEGTDLDVDPTAYATFNPASFNMLLAAMGLPPLLLDDAWDLAGWFAAPPLASIKQTLIDALHCLTDYTDAGDSLTCLLALAE